MTDFSSRPFRLALNGLLVAGVCVTLLMMNSAEQSSSTVEAHVLTAADGKQWYRGNLHTHSLWSDGDDYLEAIGLWYREHDYDFLCYTDHNILATSRERWSNVDKNKGGRNAFDKLKQKFPGDWVEERTTGDVTEVRLKTFEEVFAKLAVPGKFLLIQGEEVTDRFGRYPVHMNVSNIKEPLPPMGGESVYDAMQNNINAMIAQRERTGQTMMMHLNHPNFGYGVTAEDLMRVRGENFFEVYNGHPGVNNSGNAENASTERIWDIILTKRLAELKLPVMFGLATDDGHSYHKIPSRASEPGRGWVMVLADGLAPTSLIESLERGDFYSSSGVSLENVTSSNEGLDLKVAAEDGVTYRIDFIGTRKGFEAASEPVKNSKGNEIRATRRYSDDIGVTLKSVDGTSGSYRFSGDEIYVRAVVTSSKKHPNPSEVDDAEQAWAQPVVGPAAVR